MIPRINPWLSLLGITLLWAAYGVLVRFFESEGFNPFELNFASFAAATLILGIVLALQKKDLSAPQPAERIPLLLYAIGLCSTNIAIYYAFTLSTLANTILLHYTALLWASLGAVIWFKEELTRWKIISFLLVMGGVMAISLPDFSLNPSYFTGNLFALASAFGYALMLLASRKLKGMPSEKSAWYGMLACTILLAPLWLAWNSAKTIMQWASVLAGAGTYTAAESLLLMSALQGIAIVPASLVLVSEIPLVAALGLLLYGEAIPLATLAGGVLIIAGAILLIFKEQTGRI
ncbi:MAG: DMT family transporter [Candidatus Diapherotrites archaeon]|nr:DMT family transporter [Candidatus Diapherotrites archaeon]